MTPSTAARHARVAAKSGRGSDAKSASSACAASAASTPGAAATSAPSSSARRMAARPTRVPREGLWNMFSVSETDTENRKSTSAPIGRGTSGGKDAVGRRHSGFPKTEARTVPATVRKKSRPRSR